MYTCRDGETLEISAVKATTNTHVNNYSPDLQLVYTYITGLMWRPLL